MEVYKLTIRDSHTNAYQLKMGPQHFMNRVRGSWRHSGAINMY